MKTLSSLNTLLAVAALGMGSAMSPAGLGMGAPTSTVVAPSRATAYKRIRSGGGQDNHRSYPNGPGWTHAQVQRMAKKRRNVKANRRNHRG